MADSKVDSGVLSRVAPVGVLFLNGPTKPPLGADTWVHGQILRRLDRRDHRLHAACVFGEPGRPTPTYELFRDIDAVNIHSVNLGVEISRGSIWTTIRGVLAAVLPALLSMFRLIRLVRRHRIDIVHTCDRPRDAVAGVLLAAVTRTKCIVHVHVAWGTWMSRALRWSLRRADGLIAVSEFVAATLVEAGHDRDRIHIVLNAIDITAWTPRAGREDARREFGVGSDGSLVLSVCRLFPEKGPAELIRACAIARHDVPRLRLVIAGSGGHYTTELANLVEQLDMSADVVLAGRRDDIPSLMAAADVFSMPSYGEPFGLVFTEAMAMELPVVALNHGGTIEVVEHGATGLLAEPGDIDGLAGLIVKLLQDQQLRDNMGRSGRARVLERFTVDRMAADVALVYRRVLRDRKDEW